MKYNTSGDYKLLGYRCIAEEPYMDEIIVGKYGCIYKGVNKLYNVVFWSPQVAKRWGVEITQGEEGHKLVTEIEAKKIRKELKTFRSLEKQAEHLIAHGG